jgi:hypothetical protein
MIYAPLITTGESCFRITLFFYLDIRCLKFPQGRDSCLMWAGHVIIYIVLKKRHNQHNALPPFVRVRLFYLSFTMIQ